MEVSDLSIRLTSPSVAGSRRLPYLVHASMDRCAHTWAEIWSMLSVGIGSWHSLLSSHCGVHQYAPAVTGVRSTLSTGTSSWHSRLSSCCGVHRYAQGVTLNEERHPHSGRGPVHAFWVARVLAQLARFPLQHLQVTGIHTVSRSTQTTTHTRAGVPGHAFRIDRQLVQLAQITAQRSQVAGAHQMLSPGRSAL